MFIDIAKIKIVSGKGGDGKVGFHREKYVAAGGPDGGDGGRGGSVIFKVDDNLSTLLDFRYKKKYVAAPGEPGGGKRCKGKDGADLVIRVPRGTIIRDQKTGQVMKDMSDSEPFVAAKGGNGGWGNTHFATPTRQAPRFAKPGLPGVERDIIPVSYTHLDVYKRQPAYTRALLDGTGGCRHARIARGAHRAGDRHHARAGHCCGTEHSA